MDIKSPDDLYNYHLSKLKSILEIKLVLTRGEICLIEFAIDELRQKLTTMHDAGQQDTRLFNETLDRLQRRIRGQVEP